MRFALGSLIAVLLLLGCLPAAGWATAANSPAAPSCAAGPARSGDTIVGTPCADRIVVPASVRATSTAEPATTRSSAPTAVRSPRSPARCETGCHLEVGSQTFEGGPGNDIVYGDRGNDTLRGNAGNDRLYGGIGDDVLEGGEGDDLLSGGFGADKIDGQEGNDYVRGDATIDHIFDTGGGIDTLSFATGIDARLRTGDLDPAVQRLPRRRRRRARRLPQTRRREAKTPTTGSPPTAAASTKSQPGVFERIIGTPLLRLHRRQLRGRGDLRRRRRRRDQGRRRRRHYCAAVPTATTSKAAPAPTRSKAKPGPTTASAPPVEPAASGLATRS